MGALSNRKLEPAAYDSIATRSIVANDHLDHNEIALFRCCFFREIAARGSTGAARMPGQRSIFIRSACSGERWRVAPPRNFDYQLACHGFAERMKIMDFLHKTTWSSSDILPIIFGQPTGRLDVGEGPGHRMVVDNRQAIDDNACLNCIVARVRNLSSSIVGAIAAHVDHAS